MIEFNLVGCEDRASIVKAACALREPKHEDADEFRNGVLVTLE
jgi:hypothetical protein